MTQIEITPGDTVAPVAHRLQAGEAIRRLMHPRAVALVGASDDPEKFSGQPLRNLRHAGYTGGIHPVNLRATAVGGLPAVRTVAELPQDVDTAMVMVPAAACAQVVRDLGAAGVHTAIVAVSGFAEVGTAAGKELQEELRIAGLEAGVRLVGPNCNGIYETREPLPLGYNYTHSQILARGSVALVAHSGAMLGGFVPLLESYGAGLSAFVSCGNEVDLELLDYVEYFIEDPDTAVIALILDGVHDGARLRRAIAAAHGAGKPVIALKLGNSSNGSAAAQAHSSRLAGTKAAYDAVFAADGVVNVPTLETLAVASALLAHGRVLTSTSVVGLSTSGAGGVLLADTFGAQGLRLAQLSPATVGRLADTVGFAQAMNPFDIGAAGAASVEANLSALAADPGAGALVFYLTPTPTLSWRRRLAEGVAAVATAHPALPIVVVSPAPVDAEAAEIYRAAGVPVVVSTLDAAVALGALAAAVTEPIAEAAGGTAVPPADAGDGAVAGTALSEARSRAFLRAGGVPVPEEVVADSADAAVAAAARIGYPVVAKAAGSGLTHKTEEGLVRLGLADADAVRAACDELSERGRRLDPDGYEGVLVTSMVTDGEEVVIGVSTDPDFGPLVLFGAGGVTAELVADVALAPAPLDRDAARRLIARTRVARLLDGYRGSAPLDVEALIDVMVAVSVVAAKRAGEIVAIDLNPVRVLPAGEGVAVLDALVVTR
jgi:acyl-CoA synthetase (NDP forming)